MQIIYSYICSSKKEKDILNVFGNNWPTPDGAGIRDYIHVDIAEAKVALSKIYNTEKISVRLILALVKEQVFWS